jgi:hypothetical protein
VKTPPARLVSAEGLSFLRTPAERAKLALLARAISARIVPIVVFRSDDDGRASFENQLKKDAAVRARMGDPRFTLLRDGYFDKAAILRFWSALGEVRRIGYDAAMTAQGDIIKPRLAVLRSPASRCPTA